MPTGQWLKENTVLPDQGTIFTLYVKGTTWQIYTTKEGGYALAAAEELYGRWLQRGLLEEGLLLPLSETLSGKTVYAMSVPSDEIIASVEYGPYPHLTAQAAAFAGALKTSLRKTPVSLEDGIYISRFSAILPTFEAKGKSRPAYILGCWICAGMQIPVTDTERIRKYAGWLSDTARISLLEMFDLKESEADASGTTLSLPSPMDGLSYTAFADTPASPEQAERKKRQEGSFSLPGRSDLERFFREDILDVIDREEEYQRFGVGFPGAVLLYGPSGSGKTFAVEKLAEYLGWPVFRITSGTIGSKWVHETSRMISEVFDQAIREAPSVLIIDEMEAFLSSRDNARGNWEIHLEEVGEFLRRIPDAAENHVLLFGMTNLIASIDEAILRKGRFDHLIEVGMPSAAEVKAVLENQLRDLPTQGQLSLDRLSEQLEGRPLSDVTFVVEEAGKICVRKRRKGIDRDALEEALSQLKPGKKQRKKIGFSL